MRGTSIGLVGEEEEGEEEEGGEEGGCTGDGFMGGGGGVGEYLRDSWFCSQRATVES